MTTLSSEKLIAIATRDPGAMGGVGFVEAALRQLGRDSGQVAHQQRTGLTELRDLLAALPDRPKPALSPLDRNVSAKPAPFTASDVLWLQRLPAADAVSDTEYVELAKLEAQAGRGSGDARLIGSIIAPVRARLQAAKSAAELASLKAVPVTPVPASLVQAVADTVVAELPALAHAEAAGLAAVRLRAALDARDAALALRVAEAETRAAAA